jgi:putative nucleotidyltransferase with HDIG domain
LPEVLRIEAAPLRTLLGEIAAFCDANGVVAYATGGFLRDALLVAPIHDIDLTVAGDPLVMGPPLAVALGGTYFPLREERGQARILVDGGLHIDLMPLRAPDIEADLRLRDYTVDALGAALDDLAIGEAQIIDPTGGLADLRAGVVRMTGETALVDDPLRLLRGPRIATQFGFRIEPETAEAIRRNAGRLAESGVERQRDELIRIFATERAADGVRLLDQLGLFARVLPEMEVTRGVEQPKEHHYDVLGHSLAAVGALDMLLSEQRPAGSPARQLWDEVWRTLEWCTDLREYFGEEIVPGTPRRALLKLCGLLHDIGKPETKSIEAGGRMRFFGHSDAGARIAGGLMRRLRFSSREVAMVEAMIDAHLRPVQLGADAQGGRPSKRAIYRFFRDTADAGIETLFLSLADHLATVGPSVSVDGFRWHVALTAHILHLRFDDETTLSPPRLVDGDDLMAALGIGPGALLGELLEAVREAQAAGEIQTREQALSLARARLAESRASAGQ